MTRDEFERMAPPLRKRIVSMVMGMSASADPSLAEDVAQDTLMRLWTLRDRLDEYRNVDSLAIVIARHRAIDLLRENSVTSVGLDSITETSSTPSPEDHFINTESTRDVLGIIASLPSVQQAIITMLHIDGLEISEIARITGSTPGAIRTALSRARQSIKDIFMQQK